MDWNPSHIALSWLALVATPSLADWSAVERFETQAAPASSCPTCIQRLPGGGWRIADDEGGLAAFAADGRLAWRVDPRIDGVRARTWALALAPDGAACLVQWRIGANPSAVIASRVDADGDVAWVREVAPAPVVDETAQGVHCQADGGALLALGDRVQSRDPTGALRGEHRLPAAQRIRASAGGAGDGLVALATAVDGGAPLTVQRYSALGGLIDERIEDLAPSTSAHAVLADAQGALAVVRVRHAAGGAASEVGATRFGPDLAERWRGSIAVAAPVFGVHARAQDDGGLAVAIRLDDAVEGLRVAWWGADGALRWSPYFDPNDPDNGGNLRFAASADGTLWYAISRGAGTIWRTGVRQVVANGGLLRSETFDGPAALGVQRIDLAGPARVEMVGISGIAEDPSQPVAAGTALQFGSGATTLFRGLPVPMTGTAQAIALDAAAVVGTAHADGPLRSTLRTVAWSLDGSEILRREQPFDGWVGSARSLLLGDGAVLQVAIDEPVQAPRRFVARRLDGTLAWTRSIEEPAARRVVDAWRLSPTEAVAVLETGRLLRIALDGSGIVGQSLATPSAPQGLRRQRVGSAERLLAWQLRGAACWVRAFDDQGAPVAGVDASCPQFAAPPAESAAWAAQRADGGWILVTAGLELFFQPRLRYLAYSAGGMPEATRSVDLAGVGVLRASASESGTALLIGSISPFGTSPARLLRFDAGHALREAIVAPTDLRPDGSVRPTADGGVEGLGFASADGRLIAFRLRDDGGTAALDRGATRLRAVAEAIDASAPGTDGLLLAAGQSDDAAPDRAGHAVFLVATPPLFSNGFE